MDINLTRRQFAVTAIASGFALAVQPVAASAIHTNDTGIETGEGPLAIRDDKSVINGYFALPKGTPPYPTIIVVHEIFGVHEFIKDVCRRFAKEGYLAIAPNLFDQIPDVQTNPNTNSLIGEISQNAPDTRVISDLHNVVKAAGRMGDPDRIGITGFCWGGRAVWLFDEAIQPPQSGIWESPIKAAVAWYGMVGKNPFGDRQALDNVSNLRAPVLGLYGGKDSSIPVDTLEQMRAALKANNKPGEIVIYPDAGHGFFADYRPSYDPKAAAEAWPRCLAWFKNYLS